MPSPGTAGGRVRIYIDGDAADLERAVKQSNSALARLGLGQSNLATKTQLANAVADQQRRNLSAVATGAKYAAGGLAVLGGAGLAKATADGIRFNAEMESSQLALKNFLGGAKETQDYLDKLYALAKETPFEFTDLTSASQRLLAFGLDADRTYKILNATGDAIAAMGGNAENIDRVTLALGQMQAKGRASAEELMQLNEAGIPTSKILQKELGLTGEQVANIADEGIRSEKVIDALTRGMEDRFGGMAAKQAKTWSGLTSSMHDNWSQMTGAMTSDLFDEAKRWAPKVNETMEDITSIFERKDLSFEEKVQRSIDAIDVNLGPLVDEIGDQLDEAELGEHLIDAVDWAIPRVAEHAGRLGLEVAEGLVTGFIHADPIGKLFIAGSVMRLVAGNAGFSILGGAMASKAGGAMAARMPAAITRGVSSVGGWGPAGAIIATSLAVAYEGAKGPLGKAVQDEIKDSLLNVSGGDDYLENLKNNIPKIDGEGLDNIAEAAKEAGHTLKISLVKAWVAAGDISEEQGDRIIDSIEQVRGETQNQSYIDFATTNRTFKNNIEALHRGFANSMGGIRRIGKETSEEIEAELGKGSAAGRRAMSANYRAMADNVDRLVDRGVLTTAQGEKRKAELIERSKLVTATEEQARKMGKAWTKGLSDQEQFTKKHVDDVINSLQRMPGPAQKAAAQVWLGQLREAAKGNPKLMAQFRDLRELIVDQLGIAAVRGTKKAGDLRDGAGANFLSLSDVAGGAFLTIIQNLNNSLGALGAGTEKVEYKPISSSGKHPGVGLQQGGPVFQVPGYGTCDSFHTSVPAGSFVLNRNAVAEYFGLQRGGMANVVLEPGELVFGPGAVAQMGGALAAMNSNAPRFAEGGLAGAHPTVSNFVSGLIGKYGGSVSSGLRGADSDSLHSTGQAIDYVPGNWPAAAAAVNRSGSSLLEGIYNPAIQGGPPVSWDSGAQVPPSFWGSSTWAGHMDHIHIAIADGAKVAATAAAREIKRVMIDGPDGPVKDMAQAAVDKAHKAANAYLSKHSPTVGPEAFPKGGGIDIGSLPPALQKWNKRFPGAVLQNDPGAWMSLTEMPFNVAAAIAEWAGMPGVTMAQVSKGEGGLKPGSMGDDDLDGDPDGYGWLAITRPYGAAYGVDKYGGYEGMLNPVANAIVAKGMYDSQGLGAWYGQRFVTDTNAHYSGPLLGKQRGGYVGMASGGKAKPTKGEFAPGPATPPPAFGPALPSFPGAKAPKMSYEQQMTFFGIGLTYAQETTTTEDDLAILQAQLALVQGETDRVTGELADLHLTGKDKDKARKQAVAATAAMRKKFMKDGELSSKEQRRLEAAEAAEMKKAGQKILDTRRGELLDQLSGLTGELSSTKDSIESLNEEATESLAELVESMKSLADEMAEHNRLLSQETTTQRTELIRALADLMDGEIGGRVDAYSNTAGYGQVVAV